MLRLPSVGAGVLAGVVLWWSLNVPAGGGQADTPAKKTPAAMELRGVVVDEHGKAVAGATVHGVLAIVVGNGASWAALPEQTTDAAGRFTMPSRGNPLAAPAVVYLRAAKATQHTAGALAVRDEALRRAATLVISDKNAQGLKARIVDDDGRPIAGAAVEVKHQIDVPLQQGTKAAIPVEQTWAFKSNDAGQIETPRTFAPVGSYRLTVQAKGYVDETTPWKPVGGDKTLSFDDVKLCGLRPLAGQVVDRQGKPVAGARVVQQNIKTRDVAKTDGDGRFTLETTTHTPGFLFVEHAGFRFHGQRSGGRGPVTVTLARRDEPPVKAMKTLPPALPREERLALARGLFEPTLREALAKGSDDARLRPFQTLGSLDPGRLLEELETKPFKDAWYDGYLRRAAVGSVLAASPDEARTIADSIKDPGFRAICYLDLFEAVAAGERHKHVELLNQALLHSRGQKQDHRVLTLAHVARLLWGLGDKERAAKLLAEGHAIARELPSAGWSGYARGAFAEDLALIDVPAALELMRDLKDDMELRRHHGNLAHKLGARDPIQAEKLLELFLTERFGKNKHWHDSIAVRVCHRMAAVDLARARGIAKRLQDAHHKARAYAVMAQAIAGKDRKEAQALLEQAFAVLDDHVAAGKDQFNNAYNAATVAALMIPVAEKIDPALTGEFFWRTLALQEPPRARKDGSAVLQRPHSLERLSYGALALAIARYDYPLAVEFALWADQEDLKGYDRGYTVRALVLADPKRAVRWLEEGKDRESIAHYRDAAIRLLLLDGEALWRNVHNQLGIWHVDSEDL